MAESGGRQKNGSEPMHVNLIGDLELLWQMVTQQPGHTLHLLALISQGKLLDGRPVCLRSGRYLGQVQISDECQQMPSCLSSIDMRSIALSH